MKAIDRLTSLKKNITAKALIDVGYPVFVKNTPIDTGNARRRTTKTNNSIEASYPYAKRLDEGYSHQSPDGMVKPTLKAMTDYIRKQIGK